MNDKEFDDIIRNRLENHGSSVPSDMWERITSKEEKRGGGPFQPLTLLLIFLLLLVFVAIYFLPNSDKTASGRKTAAGKLGIENASDLPKSNTNTTTKNEQVDKKGSASGTSGIASGMSTSNERVAGDTKEKNDVTIYKPAFGQAGKKYSNRKGKKKIFTRIHHDNAALIPNHERDKTTAVNPSSDEGKNFGDSAVAKQEKDETLRKTDSTAAIEGASREEQGDKFYLELFAGPAMPINEINASSKPYESLLKDAGSPRLSFAIGARFKYEFSKKFSAKLGLQYTEINEKVSVTPPAAAYSYSSVNRFKNFGVPILGTYKTAWLPDIPVSINAGFVFNISSRYKGLIPAASGQPIDITSDNVYSRNASVQLFLSFDASKRIGKKAELFAEPWFSYQTKSIVNRMYAFNQKPHVIGVAFGWRYRLFNLEK